MTEWIKQGVMGDLHPKVQKCKARVITLYESNGKDFYLTSVREATHKGGSFHYIGYAFDFRQQGMPKASIQAACGQGFDVIQEDAQGIFHVEWDEWQ